MSAPASVQVLSSVAESSPFERLLKAQPTQEAPADSANKGKAGEKTPNH